MAFQPSDIKRQILAAYLPPGTIVNAHLLTAVLTDTIDTVAELTQAAGGNYAAKPLTTTAAALVGTSAIVNVSDGPPLWSNLYTSAATPIVEMAFSKQIGGASAGSDPVLGSVKLTETTTIASVTTTADSVILTTTGSFAGLAEGYRLAGTGLAFGSVIDEITSATQIVMSRPATASGTITLTVYVPAPYTPSTSSGSQNTLTVPLPPTGVLAHL
ncbi:hypothetical protein H6F86_20445 [Phormidium sp. FACHB-592]|uniref:Uncharacterized protein n=1 Tax=Stenomitos frigidus AS-A4 TaxID=2933935 RepID=A0ABV0KED9_9CYAN|nr:hypothetical protein [Phormidium sp. FACHB-592]MBD2076202.1 hypothetical protein [Phormidium sp. FACHB-592]